MTPLTLRGPADIAAALPSLLGFHPSNSLVVIAFRDGRIVLTMRVDLPDQLDPDWPFQVLARTMQSKPDAYVFVIADTTFHEAEVFGAELVAELMEASECEVLDALMVGGDRWRSYLCDGECCPRVGTPISREDVERIRCAMTLTGQALATDRDAIRAEFALGDEPIEDTRFDGRVKLRRERIESVLDRLCRQDAPSIDDELIAFIVALRDRRVRDAALWIVTSQSDATNHLLLRQLAALMRRTPDAWVDGVGVVAATTAWLVGDGARGIDACERALSANPESTLAQLLHSAMAAGLPPSMWRDGMRSITLDECWAGELKTAS